MFKSNRLEADMSGVFSVFLVKSLRSGFWTTLFDPFPNLLVIDLTAFSTRGTTTLYIVVEIAACMQFSTVMTALLTAFLKLLSMLFPKTWVWPELSTIFSELLYWPLLCGSSLIFHCTHIGIITNSKIAWGPAQLGKLFPLLLCLLSCGNHFGKNLLKEQKHKSSADNEQKYQDVYWGWKTR